MSKLQLNACIIIVLILAVAACTKVVRPLKAAGRLKTTFQTIPMKFNGWTGEEGKFDPETYRLLPTASLLYRFYLRDYDVSPVALAIVYGSDLGNFHQPEVCLEGQGLQSVSKSIVKVKDGNGGTIDAVSLITQSDSEYARYVFLFWFYTDGSASTSLGSYKLRILGQRLMMRNVRPSAMIRLSTPVVTTEQEAIDQLVTFASDIYPHLIKEFESGAPAKSTGKE